MRRFLSALLVSLALPLAGTGCGKAAYGRDDLQESLAKHYINLRWGRLANAASYVSPELRPAFVEDWEKRAQAIELQDFDVVQVTVSEDGDTAEVLVQLSWVENATMSLKSARLAQTWVRTDEGWRTTNLLELP